MPRALPKTRRRRIAIGAVVLTLVVLFFVSGVVRWSPLNCWNDYIDINSGRVRHTWFLLYCKVGDRTEETWLSQASDGPSPSPNWRCVNTFSPFVHYSPHYRYHGAIYQLNRLAALEELVPFDPAARRKVARSLLAQWQSTGSDSGAYQYLGDVERVVCSLHDNGASVVTVSDLPDEIDSG